MTCCLILDESTHVTKSSMFLSGDERTVANKSLSSTRPDLATERSVSSACFYMHHNWGSLLYHLNYFWPCDQKRRICDDLRADTNICTWVKEPGRNSKNGLERTLKNNADATWASETDVFERDSKTRLKLSAKPPMVTKNKPSPFSIWLQGSWIL